MSDSRQSIKDALRRMSRSTSVEQLRKKGVQKVNILGLDRIAALIEEAVRRSLKDRMLGVESDEVAEQAKSRFIELYRSNANLRRDNEAIDERRRQAESELDKLRRDLSAQQQALRDKLDEAIDEEADVAAENARVKGRVRALFKELAEHPGRELADIQAQVMDLVLDLVGEERRATADATAALREREVDQLQRRISKLSDALDRTEQRLVEAAQGGGDESGLASIYREVQGLSSRDRNFEKKKELMANIFQANLVMQKSAKVESTTGR